MDETRKENLKTGKESWKKLRKILDNRRQVNTRRGVEKESGVAVTFTSQTVRIYQEVIPGDGASCHNWQCDIIGVCGEVNDEIGAMLAREKKKVPDRRELRNALKRMCATAH